MADSNAALRAATSGEEEISPTNKPLRGSTRRNTQLTVSGKSSSGAGPQATTFAQKLWENLTGVHWPRYRQQMRAIMWVIFKDRKLEREYTKYTAATYSFRNPLCGLFLISKIRSLGLSRLFCMCALYPCCMYACMYAPVDLQLVAVINGINWCILTTLMRDCPDLMCTLTVPSMRFKTGYDAYQAVSIFFGLLLFFSNFIPFVSRHPEAFFYLCSLPVTLTYVFTMA